MRYSRSSLSKTWQVQYGAITNMAAVTAVVLWLIYMVREASHTHPTLIDAHMASQNSPSAQIPTPSAALTLVDQVDAKLKVSAFQLATFTAFSFILGALCSAFAG